MPDQDPYANIAFDDPYAAIAQPISEAARKPDAVLPPTAKPAEQPGFFSRLASATPGWLWDQSQGVGKGFQNTVSGISDAIHSIPVVGPKIIPQEGLTAFHKMNEPTAAEKLGYNGEQAAEYMLPGALPEETGLMAARAATSPGMRAIAAPIVRAATNAFTSGVQNKLQGGDFGTGALAGGVSSGATDAMKALAPSIADTALGFRRADRMRGKIPGVATLEETTGINPDVIAQQARDRSALIEKKLENAASAQSRTPASVSPSLQMLDAEAATAHAQNNGELLKKVNQLKNRITMDLNGQPFPNPTTPEQVLNLKRGIGDLVSTWAPQENTKQAQSIVQRLYGVLDGELDRTVPEAQALNDRMSSLIPVAKRAEEKAAAANTPQRIALRVAAHTGALTGAAFGYTHGGIPGAVAGLVLPEVLTSPTLQMGAELAMNSPITSRFAIHAAKGLGLQLVRPIRLEEEQGRDAAR